MRPRRLIKMHIKEYLNRSSLWKFMKVVYGVVWYGVVFCGMVWYRYVWCCKIWLLYWMSAHALVSHGRALSLANRCGTLKGNCHEQFNLKKTAWTSQVWFKATSMQGKTARIWRAFGGERDKREDSVNEKRPENLACCHKRIYLKAWQLMTVSL